MPEGPHEGLRPRCCLVSSRLSRASGQKTGKQINMQDEYASLHLGSGDKGPRQQSMEGEQTGDSQGFFKEVTWRKGGRDCGSQGERLDEGVAGSKAQWQLEAGKDRSLL